ARRWRWRDRTVARRRSVRSAASRRTREARSRTDPVGGRSLLGRLVGGREQVGRRKAAKGPPLLGDVKDLLLAREVVEGIGALHGLAQREIPGKHDVLSPEGDEERALGRPRADAGYRSELGDELLVRQRA